MGSTREVVLGPQAKQVLELGLQGLSDKEIAQRLGMSPSTVRTHFARICGKYGAANRCQLAHIATQDREIEMATLAGVGSPA